MMQAAKKCKKTEMEPERTISDCNSWFLFPITERDGKVVQDFAGMAPTVLQDDLTLTPWPGAQPHCGNTRLIFSMKQARTLE